MESGKQSVSVTGEQALAWLRGERCVCGAAKDAGKPFCLSDWLALPLYLRTWLSAGARSEYFAENFRRAWQHLADLGPQRREHLGQSPAGAPMRWRYNSDQELLDAGYRLARDGAPTRCAAPRCNAQIRWWITPGKKYLAVNYAKDDCRPHFVTCADPDYFRFRQERRKVQASARRKRRRA